MRFATRVVVKHQTDGNPCCALYRTLAGSSTSTFQMRILCRFASRCHHLELLRTRSSQQVCQPVRIHGRLSDPLLLGPSTEKRSLSVDTVSLSDHDREPPQKRQKMMDFSLEHMHEDDDDEDGNKLLISPSHQPLPSHRAKKGHKTQAGTAPASIPPPTGLALAEMNGQITHEEPRIKLEDKMDEGQLSRLATGVTVDTDNVAATVRTTVTPKYGALDSHALRNSTRG